MWSIEVTKDDPKHRGGPGGSIEGSKRFYFCFTRTVLPGPTHLKSPPGIPKTIVIYIIYKYIIVYILYKYYISFKDDLECLGASRPLFGAGQSIILVIFDDFRPSNGPLGQPQKFGSTFITS